MHVLCCRLITGMRDCRSGEEAEETITAWEQNAATLPQGAGLWGGGRSTMLDPDGHILQEADINQTFLTR